MTPGVSAKLRDISVAIASDSLRYVLFEGHVNRRPPGETDPSHVRDYYRVEDDTGARYWLFRAGLSGGEVTPKWWLHGLG